MHKLEIHTTTYAEIIIPLAVPINYTWEIPAHLMNEVKVGVRVEVELGKKKKYAGIVKLIHNQPPEFFTPKPILNVLDKIPVVHPQQLQLWTWMANYYMCTEGEVMAAALPAHFKLSSETILVFNEEAGEDFTELDNEAYLIAEALSIKKELKITEVQDILGNPHVYPIINRLIQNRICFVWEALIESYVEKKENYVYLHPQFDNEVALEALLNNNSKLNRAEKQLELLLGFLHLQKTESDITQSSLLKKANASSSHLKGLIEKGILYIERRRVDRIKQLPGNVEINFTLSNEQLIAHDQITDSFKSKNICLLHGVTSSGKTEIYIRQIETMLLQGKQVLYMLPEIALTAQTIRRLQKHFGGHIGVYHSKFSQNERVEIWNKVKDGSLKIVVGARSAIFLPFESLGLIICDEEHDSSFKQIDPAPRYNARDAAIYMPYIWNDCKVLLGSATPSYESYFQAVQGKYGLVVLNKRFGDIPMPQIEIVNTANLKIKKDENAIISEKLQNKIREDLLQKKQVILFQNRRGYTPYQQCATCGWIPKCKYCDVSLTYHKYQHKLACHYCGNLYAPLHTCAACGGHEFQQKQFGTERIEEIVQALFAEAKTGRMDIDMVRGKNAHDQLIQTFENHQLDILVGTQMIVKGLDFGNVDLVGIIDADGILSFTDFRVNERAFQLMEQVSGRAGRKSGNGKVLIQATHVMHPVLLYVLRHDFIGLYHDELEKRNLFQYPPFTKLIRLTLKHKLKEVVVEAAEWMANVLRNKYGSFIMGPSAPIVGRIRNQYLMEIIIKLPRKQSIIETCKKDILEGVAIMHQDKRLKSVTVVPDVDFI